MLEVAAENTVVPPPETIKEAAFEITQRSYYDLTPYDYDLSLLKRILDFLKKIFDPFFDLFQTLAAISPVLAWTVMVILFVIAAALIVHIAYSFKIALRGRKQALAPPILDEALATSPDRIEQQARTAAESSNYVESIRLLLRAAIIRLERANRRKPRPSITNREYLSHFKHTDVYPVLSFLVDLTDVKWYGDSICTEEDYIAASNAHTQLTTLAKQAVHG